MRNEVSRWAGLFSGRVSFGFLGAPEYVAQSMIEGGGWVSTQENLGVVI